MADLCATVLRLERMSEAASGDAGCQADGNIAAIFRSLVPSPRAAFVTASRTVSWADWLGSVEQFARRTTLHCADRASALLMRPCGEIVCTSHGSLVARVRRVTSG